MRPTDATRTISGIVKHATDRAVLLEFDDGREAWIPKSAIRGHRRMTVGKRAKLRVPQWLVEAEGLDAEEVEP